MKRIIGSKFNKIYRCIDMLCLCLGEDIVDKEGNRYSQYAFHIQTSWRFIKDNNILLGSRDIYLPQDESLDDGYYDYNEQSNPDIVTNTSSIFDAHSHEFYKNFENAKVKNYSINAFGDLRIDFTNGIYFETFTPSNRKCEEWRFIGFEDEEHFIVFDIYNK